MNVIQGKGRSVPVAILSVAAGGIVWWGALAGPVHAETGENGPEGFPTGSALEVLEQGTGGGSVTKHPHGLPTDPALGPPMWSQEGGGETRNPYFSAAPAGSRKTRVIVPEEKPSPGEEDGSGGPGVRKKKTSPISWSRRFGSGTLDRLNFDFAHQPVVLSGRLLLSSTRGQVLCLDAVSGDTLWKTSLPEGVWAPAVGGGQVLYLVSGTPLVTAHHMVSYAQTRTIRRGDGSGHLYALSLATGKVIWTAPVPGPALGSPVLAGKILWVATGAGILAGYSTEKEKRIFEIPLTSSSGWSAPLYVHHWVWLSLEGPTKLLALWPEKKRTVWALTTPPRERLVLFTPTSAFGDKRLVTLFRSLKGDVPQETLAIVSAVTGHLFHELSIGGKSSPVEDRSSLTGLPPYARVWDGPAEVTVSGKTALVASELFRKAVAVDIPSGHLFWSVPLPGRPAGSGTLVGGLYVLPLRGTVDLLNLSDGKPAGRIPFSGRPSAGSPPVVGQTLYLSGRNGDVRAIPLGRYGKLISPKPAASPSLLPVARGIGASPPDLSGE